MYGAFRSGHTCEPENRTDRRKVPHGKGSTERYMKIRRIIGRFAPVSAHCGRPEKGNDHEERAYKTERGCPEIPFRGPARQTRSHPHQTVRVAARPVAGLLPRRSLSVPRNREEPRGRIQIYLEDQSGGRHLQRNGSTRSGRHRSAGRQTRHGRKRTAFQNIRTTRTNSSGRSRTSLPPSAASTWRISKPRSVSSSKSGCAANSTSP